MVIHDISWPLCNGMTSYKNQYPYECKAIKTFKKDQVRFSSITMSSHMGTHVDAPSHFINDGKTIDQIPLNQFCGKAVVLDLVHVENAIEREHLELQKDLIEEGLFVLCKTNNSFIPSGNVFNHDFVYLAQSAASYLVQKNIKGIGFDYLGIERSQMNHETHTIFLTAGVTVVEGLRLEKIQKGYYNFSAFPLLMIGSDGAPARALLYEL